jgi:imidazole glycerol-phosphate synthase subunit HisF
MLKKRLIPKLLIRHRQLGRSVRPVLVTTKGFSRTIEVGDAVSQAKIYEAQLADELVVLNIDRTPIDQDEVTLELIERLASETFMPLCVGGGVNSVEDFSLLLDRGADKVSINTAAMRNPELITRSAARFGAQCVVVSIDYHVDAQGRAWVRDATQAWAKPCELTEWAQRAVSLGAGELLLCDADR